MLKLVHIKNISESDTPSFTTQTEQEDYFDNLQGITITDGWYPPYYENEIKFDTEDVSFDTNYNYLILSYNDRNYYYFIDDMTYVNEGVIAIHITMDTIQTFMFGATLSDVVIERKFINRWRDNYINRNYIRENLSENNYKTVEFEYLTNSNDYFTFVSFTKYDLVDWGAFPPARQVLIDSVIVNTPNSSKVNFTDGLVVFYKTLNSTIIQLNGNNVETENNTNLTHFRCSTSISSIRTFPFCPLANLTYNVTGTNTVIDYSGCFTAIIDAFRFFNQYFVYLV